jgi:hypothetical protein
MNKKRFLARDILGAPLNTATVAVERFFLGLRPLPTLHVLFGGRVVCVVALLASHASLALLNLMSVSHKR